MAWVEKDHGDHRVSRDGASTTSLGNLFQLVTTLCVKSQGTEIAC